MSAQTLTLELPSDERLLQIARMKLSPGRSVRLQELLTIRQERDLTPREMDEATELLAKEDAITLKKARALFLLQQRGVWSDNLEQIFPKIKLPITDYR